MSSPLKRLAGQTVVYGMSSIVGRLLNYLLVPLYTRVFVPEEYGVVTELYAYVAFLVVLFTYGMETAFFRYNHTEKGGTNVFSTAMLSILGTSTFLVGILVLFSGKIANVLEYPDNQEYIIYFALIIGLDAISSIPFASLRAKNKAFRFAAIRLLNIALNIGSNLFFLLLCPYLLKNYGNLDWLNYIYDPDIGVGYVFISNLLASVFTVLLLLPEIVSVKSGFDKKLWKMMFIYSFPLLISGLAAIINETLDRVLLKQLLPYSLEDNLAIVGIYGACYKLSILMSLFIQAYRYAAEPFFFSQAKRSDAQKTYADSMKYFVIVGCLVFLMIVFYLDYFKHFIGSNFHDGLEVVPILLLANLFLGIYYNLSVWYKITDKTRFAAYISIVGALITIVINVALIPTMGYVASAWATFTCYFVMMLLSYLIGKKYYPVPYETGKLLFWIILACLFYSLSTYLQSFNPLNIAIEIQNTILLLLYLTVLGFSFKSVELKRANE